MNTFHQTDTFSDWLMKLKDIKARARIVTRVRSAEHGNFGDCGAKPRFDTIMKITRAPGVPLAAKAEPGQHP